MTPIFPKSFDNRFRGQGGALWILAALIVFKTVISVNSILQTERVVVVADGFALESFGPGAPIVLMLFASLAVGRLMMSLIALIALVRYRAMAPLIYLLFLIEYFGRTLVTQQYEIDRGAAADSFVSLLDVTVLTLLVLGFILALWPRKNSPAASSAAGE